MDPNPGANGYKITNEGGYFVYRNSLPTWLPVSRPMAGGRGLICWRTNMAPTKFNTTSDIYFFSDNRCNTAVGAEIGAGSKQYNPARGAVASGTGAGDGPRIALRRPALARAAPTGEPAIVDLLSTVGIACPWYAFPGDGGRCTSYDVGNNSKWSLDNLTHTVREFKVTAASSDAVETKLPIGYSEQSVPANAGAGTVSVNQATAISTATTTTTTNGFVIGGSVAYSSKATANILFARLESSVTVTVTGSYNYAATASKTDTTTKTVTVTNTQPALPGFTTALDVFSTKRDAHYKYDADLDFGKDNADENVTTPASAALNQSPARYHPCLAYTVGNGSVRNSILNIGAELLRAGFSPTDSSLPADRRGFLQSYGSFRTSGTCPGFPAGFASSAAFKGSGIGSYADAGYDEQGQPATKVTACVYTSPFPPKSAAARSPYNRPVSPAEARRLTDPRARVAASASPCKLVPLQSGPVSGETPGTLIDDNSLRATTASGAPAPTIAGPNHSDEVIGSNRPGETIYTGTGAFDLVRMGSGNKDRVFAGAGNNLIFGGNGSGDQLVGGSGSNEIHAGNGRHDVLSDSNGHAVLVAGSGGDTLVGHNMSGAMVGGSGADTLLATGDASRLTMAGGAGNDTYILRAGRGTPNISELPGGGNDTLFTDRSLTAPLYVENVIATGARPVTLTGAFGTRKLVANNGPDTLVAGPGPERLLGGRGNDTFVLTNANEDTATGGKGANRYVFTGTPELFQRPLALQRPANRTADLITNFRPSRGDRLVLRSTVFGAEVLNLRRSFNVVAASNPQPRCHCATLLLDTRTGVLSFDRDGTGSISDQVIAKLPGLRTIRPSWVQVAR